MKVSFYRTESFIT